MQRRAHAYARGCHRLCGLLSVPVGANRPLQCSSRPELRHLRKACPPPATAPMPSLIPTQGGNPSTCYKARVQQGSRLAAAPDWSSWLTGLAQLIHNLNLLILHP